MQLQVISHVIHNIVSRELEKSQAVRSSIEETDIHQNAIS